VSQAGYVPASDALRITVLIHSLHLRRRTSAEHSHSTETQKCVDNVEESKQWLGTEM